MFHNSKQRNYFPNVPWCLSKILQYFPSHYFCENFGLKALHFWHTLMASIIGLQNLNFQSWWKRILALFLCHYCQYQRFLRRLHCFLPAELNQSGILLKLNKLGKGFSGACKMKRNNCKLVDHRLHLRCPYTSLRKMTMVLHALLNISTTKTPCTLPGTSHA